MLTVLGACAGPGRTLDRWTLDAADGPQDVAVVLPTTLFRELPWRAVDITLSTRVALTDAERGRDLTIAFDCFHGPLVLRVDHMPAIDVGDTGMGEHRFLVPAALTARPEITVVVSGRRDLDAATWGFGAAPRLAIGSQLERSAVASVVHGIAVTALVLAVLLSVLFGARFLLDRRARSDGAFALGCMASLPMSLNALGLAPVWLYGATLPVVAIAVLYFLHLDFELGPVPRWIVPSYALVSAAFVAGAFSFAAGRAAAVAINVLAFPVYVHFFRVLLALKGGSPRCIDARILAVATLLTTLTFLPVGVTALLGVLVLDSLHVETLGLISWMVAITFVLARRQVESHRSLELASAELRRQVAERSQDLAAALHTLALGSAPAMETDRVVDQRYRVIRKIGAGGMGMVYEVERLADQRRLALKTLRGTPQPEHAARFAREAQIAAQIDHPNLLPVLDVGISDHALFLVMPLVDGGSLEQQRAHWGDEQWARPYLQQVAIGLAALHDRKIVHRDLKPANILLDGGVARIADFGLASVRAEVATRLSIPDDSPLALDDTLMGEGALTSAGQVFGTPMYMAPELADGVQDYSPASDVFAFGLVAYELMRGRPAFEVPPFLAARKGRGFSPADVAGLLPVISRCLAEKPTDRPSAQELADQLRA